MKFLPAIAAILLLSAPALAADKRVFRIDSLIATQKGGQVILQAKGAVQTGGWSKPRLHLIRNDGRVMTVEFLATPPPPDMTVIDGLVPVAATAQFRGRAGSVHVEADENEITSQVLR
ncbi:MAG TPA: hypothetical protein VGH23_09840 [Rhizomicrobium sp.]|jgi:uncharacterized protein YdeI (BOF family)